VLVALVRICHETLREADVTIRWGGEEFLVLLPETGREAALAVADRLRVAIGAAKVQRDGQVIAATVSVGVAEAGEADRGADDAVRRVDQALYRAKRSGRNRVVAG